MTVHSFGNPSASIVLFQAIDEHSLSSTENEVRILRKLTNKDFCLMAVTVDDWFCDLSPWKAPAAFGNTAFGDDADKTLDHILSLCNDPLKDYYLGGYSLSGLFSLWAAYQTDLFLGIAAASPSMWFPGFSAYICDHDIRCRTVYLSLGDRESKTKNKVMATVGDCIQNAYDLYTSRGINCTFEQNHGNHFTDVEKRCARAFSWVLENT